MSANDPADVIGSDDAENGGEEALAPTITSLDPSTSIVGALNFILTIDGTGFSEESLLFINGSEVPCTLMSDTQLTTEVASSTITVPGMYTLEVHNGALVSNPMTFEFTAAGTREGSSRKHK
jgi:hypothetical protein